MRCPASTPCSLCLRPACHAPPLAVYSRITKRRGRLDTDAFLCILLRSHVYNACYSTVLPTSSLLTPSLPLRSSPPIQTPGKSSVYLSLSGTLHLTITCDAHHEHTQAQTCHSSRTIQRQTHHHAGSPSTAPRMETPPPGLRSVLPSGVHWQLQTDRVHLALLHMVHLLLLSAVLETERTARRATLPQKNSTLLNSPSSRNIMNIC